MSEEAVKLYLEAHVTIEPVFNNLLETARVIAERHRFHVADLLIREERRATAQTFLTGHSLYPSDIFKRTQDLVRDLQEAGFQVWRYKIEDTVLDSRKDDEWELLK